MRSLRSKTLYITFFLVVVVCVYFSSRFRLIRFFFVLEGESIDAERHGSSVHTFDSFVGKKGGVQTSRLNPDGLNSSLIMINDDEISGSEYQKYQIFIQAHIAEYMMVLWLCVE